MSVPALASVPPPAPARGTAGPSGSRRDGADQDAGAAGGFAAALEAATGSVQRAPGRAPAGTDDVAADDVAPDDVAPDDARPDDVAPGAAPPASATPATPDAPVAVAPAPLVSTSPDQPAPSSTPEEAAPAVPAPPVDPAAPAVPVVVGHVAAQTVPSTGTAPAGTAATEPRAPGGTVQPVTAHAGTTSDEGGARGANRDGEGARSDLPAVATASSTAPSGASDAVVAATNPQEPQPVSQPALAASTTATPAASAVRTLDPGPAPTTPATPSPPAPAPAPLATQLAPRIGSLRSLGDGVHRLVMRVQPEEIGSVRVVAEITSDRVRIELHGGTEQAREALRAALPDLRRDLLGTDPPGTRAELDLGSAGRQAGRDRDRPATSGDPSGPDAPPAPVQLVLPRAAAGRLDVVT